MVRMTRGVCVLAAVLLAATAGCHKKNPKAEQLKALDDAYKAGVFSKDEYEAKRQALLAPPAAAPAPVQTPAAAPAPAGAADSTPAPAAVPPDAAALPPPDTTPAMPAPAAPAPSPRRQRAAPAQALPSAQMPPLANTQDTAPAAPAGADTNPPLANAPQSAPSPLASLPSAVSNAIGEPAPLSGCQDAESRAGGPLGQQERFFVASEDAVRRAALQAFANLDFTVHSSTAHEIEATKKGRLNAVVGGGTEKVILHFSSARKGGQMGTRVAGDTKRGIIGRLTQKSWTSAVLAQIGCNLRGGG